MQIKVLQHHIDRGERANSFHCPIAQAIRELHPDADRISVGQSIWIDGERYLTDQTAMDFMCMFDRGHEVHPFEFDLGERDACYDSTTR